MKVWTVFLWLLLVPFMAFAEDKAPEGEVDNKVNYVSLYPPLVGNYDAAGRLRYYKADIALRVVGAKAAETVKRHDPLIRNQLVMLFAQQTEEVLSSLDGKEQLRREALRQLRDLLSLETGKPLVEDLLFNNLVVQ